MLTRKTIIQHLYMNNHQYKEVTKMATYKDDLDILKAAEKADTNKLTFNAITELDNKGLLGRYGGEGGSSDLWPGVPIVVKYTDTEVPYEDVPDWAKIDSIYTYRRVNVLKVEDPFQIPMTAYAVVSYTDGDNYYGENEKRGDILEDAGSPVFFWTDSDEHIIRLNAQTKEAFKISGGK